jgi:hypothetical protein
LASHSASSASAFGYQMGAPALIPDPSPAMREKGAWTRSALLPLPSTYWLSLSKSAPFRTLQQAVPELAKGQGTKRRRLLLDGMLVAEGGRGKDQMEARNPAARARNALSG